MIASAVKPPTKHQLELINNIWNQLDLLIGREKAKTEIKIYIEDNDGHFKSEVRLAVKLQELKKLVENQSRKNPPEPEILLPGENEDGEQAWPDHQ